MMSRGILTVLLATQLAQVATAQPLHKAFRPPITARKIRIAIDDAVLHLRTQQQENGSISDYDNSGGGTALAALAMLAAGVDPVSDKQLQKALDFLSRSLGAEQHLYPRLKGQCLGVRAAKGSAREKVPRSAQKGF
jgi:hypothetical protein